MGKEYSKETEPVIIAQNAAGGTNAAPVEELRFHMSTNNILMSIVVLCLGLLARLWILMIFMGPPLSSLAKKPGVLVVKEPPEKIEADLEEAMDIAGAGKFQVLHCALMVFTLASALLEMIGNAFLLPAAACDLDLPYNLRGILASVPNIGVVLTGLLWGRAADRWGRKPALQLATAAAATLCCVAAFMPNLISFGLCKLAGSLFLSCPSSLGFAYAGELVPRKKRDFALFMCNGFLMLSASFSPMLAWAILSYDWHYNLGFVTFRPWRLLSLTYSLPLIICSVLMTRALESPKFLMIRNKPIEALDVMKSIFELNSGLSRDEFRVTSLKPHKEVTASAHESQSELVSDKREETVMSLLRPPHLKWLALCGFLMFGLFSLLNGMFLFAPDVVNKIMQGSSGEEGTVCVLLNNHENQTESSCDKPKQVSTDMFVIMTVTTVLFSSLSMACSMCPFSKKTLLVSMYTGVAITCLLSGLLTNRVVAGILMSALQITAMGIGPLNAYAVQLFPTSLRGTAVGAVMMCGRLGSVVGANAAGVFLAAACTATFYGFAAFIFLCAGLSFLLPSDVIVALDDSEEYDR